MRSRPFVVWDIDQRKECDCMNKIKGKIKDITSTMSLTALLTMNLFFIVLVLLAIATFVIHFGIDGGFFLENGLVTVGGGLVLVYAVSIAVAISMVIMIRKLFIRPIRETMAAMDDLAHGDFETRIDLSEAHYMSSEMKEFAESFNKTAAELAGTELLRKDFINNFSHEFKTPIVSINGFADLLLEEEIPPEDQKEYLKIIRDESRRLTELSGNILMLNRIESQTILTDRKNFRLDEQIRQCVLVTGQKWIDKNLDFRVELEDTEVSGNESLLKEVWLNLLDNAAKFSPDGEVISTIMNKRGTSIAVTITDHGPGMDENTASHCFEQFYQGDTSHRVQGNGLGLAMVKKIVELHDGSISVDTAPGRGCSVTVVMR